MPENTSEEFYHHRLVQDENAKTILLNVPLKIDVGKSPGLPISFQSLPKYSEKKARSKHSGRVRSVSAGRDKKSDLQARYWAFLFENLRRAVDDLYLTCESDDSIPAAKEVILILDNYVRDFKNLADWLKLKWDFDNTPPPQRPNSLSWEVRKTSPAPSGKMTPTTNHSSLLVAATERLFLNSSNAQKQKTAFEAEENVIKEVSPDKETTPKSNKDSSPIEEADSLKESVDANLEQTKSSQNIQSSRRTDDETNCTKKTDIETIDSDKKSDDTPDSSEIETNFQTQTNKKCLEKNKSNNNLLEKTNKESESSETKKSSEASVELKKGTSSKKDGKKSDATIIRLKDKKEQKNDLIYKIKDKPIIESKYRDSLKKSSKTDIETLKSSSESSSKLTSTKPHSTKPVFVKTFAKMTSSKVVPKTVGPSKVPSRPKTTVANSKTVAAMKNSKPSQSTNQFKSFKPIVPRNPLQNKSVIKSKVSSESRSTSDLRKSSFRHNPPMTRSVSNLVRPADSRYLKVSKNLCGGSTSSVSSSGSNRSWAEAVRGTAKSAEHLEEEENDDYGWKTVKSRSKFKQSFKCDLKNRYHLPSSAASMPCLVSEEEEDEASKENDSELVNKGKKVISIQSEDLIKKTPLEKVSEEIFSLTEESVRAHNANYSAQLAEKESAIARAEEEEQNLKREISETEKAELTEDTDGDTDADKQSVASQTSNAAFNTPLASPVTSLSWVEQIELEEQYDTSRYPGRVLHLHEKLSSPARKKEPAEAFKVHQEKQIRAQARRSKFQEEKSTKLAGLNKRIQEVTARKEILIIERADMIEDKMKKAEAKRLEHIEGIRKKAHEEDAKLKEIAFINELQAQNTRFDIMSQTQSADEKCEERLAELAEERAKKVEQREAKEARAEERRREMELKRIEDVEKLKERIRSREERIQGEQEQQRKDRIEAAREKARDREERLSTVRAAEQGMKEELQEKIAFKQETAAKRHKEKLETVRAKAFELSIQKGLKDDDPSAPLLIPYNPKKKCEVCKILITNEVQLQSHIRGRSHTENVRKASISGEDIHETHVKFLIDAPEDELDPKIIEGKERTKTLRKKIRKFKSKMSAKAIEYLKNPPIVTNSSSNRAKIGKSLKDIDKLINYDKGPWPDSSLSSLDRHLGEIIRTLDKDLLPDRASFYSSGGFNILGKIFELVSEQKTNCCIPHKSIVGTCKILSASLTGSMVNVEYVLMSNALTPIIEILCDRLSLLLPKTESSKDEDNDFGFLDSPITEPVAKAMMNVVTKWFDEFMNLISGIEKSKSLFTVSLNDLKIRASFQVSHIVAVGIVDKLSSYFHKVQDSIDGKPELGEFLISALSFLSSLTRIANSTHPTDDTTRLFSTLRHTDLGGSVSMLYGMLLHNNRPPPNAEGPRVKLPDHTLSVTMAAATLLHGMVERNLDLVQEVLGSEGISLEFRHIASYLLWYCNKVEGKYEKELLHQIILLVGYFSASHYDNQVIVKSGSQPSILQQLCTLPFSYFSQPELKRILFPTLFVTCYENDENIGILSEEVSWKLITDFSASPEGQKDHLLSLISKA